MAACDGVGSSGSSTVESRNRPVFTYASDMFARLVPVVLLAAVAPSWADPAPMSAGALPGPTVSAEVALVREELTIVVGRKSAPVHAVLWLENGPNPQAFEVGFPCDPSLDPGVAGLECKSRVAVKIDGKKIAVRLKKTGKGKHWIWPMKFAAGQKVKVEVDYKAPLRNDRYDTPFNGMGTLHYRLQTGASWAGPIKELEMRVEIPSDALVAIFPAGYQRQRGVVTWSLRDVEPSSDLAIITHPMYLGRPPAENAKEWATPKTTDELVEYATWFHGVALKKLGLPAPVEAETRRCIAESIKLMQTP